MKGWVKLPTAWINGHGLKNFRWDPGTGGDNIAALMCLMVIAHHADSETGEAAVTYDKFQRATNLSRAKVSGGLDVLQRLGIIDRRVEKRRSTYRLIGMDKKGWGALPAKPIYTTTGQIKFLRDFNLRKSVELNALKLLFLFVARRGTDTNAANISYDKITEYTGISRDKIRSAISLLVTHEMVHVDRAPSAISNSGVSNAYRIPHIRPYWHMGTSQRERLENEALAEVPF